MSTEFHIYAVEWTSSQLRLYVDNVLTQTINQTMAYPAVFFLSIYENAGWTGSVNPNDTRPKEFVVDYFRAYRPGGTQPSTYVRLRNVSTGLFLDGIGRSTNGDNAGQWSDSNSTNQRWTTVSV